MCAERLVTDLTKDATGACASLDALCHSSVVRRLVVVSLSTSSAETCCICIHGKTAETECACFFLSKNPFFSIASSEPNLPHDPPLPPATPVVVSRRRLFSHTNHKALSGQTEAPFLLTLGLTSTAASAPPRASRVSRAPSETDLSRPDTARERPARGLLGRI